jgi:hypothetical protein
MPRLLWIVGLIGCLAGCPEPKPVEPPAKPELTESDRPPLRILAMGDEAWSSSISRRWQSVSEQRLDVQTISADAFVELSSIQADILILESQWLPTVVERGWIAPLPKQILESPIEDSSNVPSNGLRQDVWPIVWRQSAMYGQRLWGIPLGVPMMAIVDSAESPRASMTWRERLNPVLSGQGIESKKSKRVDRESSDSFLLDRFLVVAANLNPRPDDAGFLFNINSGLAKLHEPWLLDAVNLFAQHYANRIEVVSLPPEKAWEDLAAKEIEWGLAWPPLSGESLHTVQSPERWVDSGRGLVAVATSKNRQSGPANRFLLWLDEDKQRQEFSTLCLAIQPAPERWISTTERTDVNRYRELMKQAFDDRFVVRELRFAGSQPYRQRLIEALQAIIRNPDSAETELQRCAAEWDQITSKIGRDVHKKRLARSFELEGYRN